MPHSNTSVEGEAKPSHDVSVDLCLLVSQRRIDQVRMALEEDPSLLRQHRWVSSPRFQLVVCLHLLTRAQSTVWSPSAASRSRQRRPADGVVAARIWCTRQRARSVGVLSFCIVLVLSR